MEQTDNFLIGMTGPDEGLDLFIFLPDLYLILSPDLKIIKATNAYLQSTGQDRRSIQSADPYAVFKNYGAAQVGYEVKLVEALKQVVKSGTFQQLEVEYFANITTKTRKKDRGGYFQISNLSVLNDFGEVIYLIHKLKDVTTVVENEQELRILSPSNNINLQENAREVLFEAHEALKKSNNLLQSVFNTTLIGMSILTPVRNTLGEIVDFTIMLVSKELENETQRTDLAGKSYLTEYPGIKASGLYDRMLKVMETGKSDHLEYFYPYDGFDKWFSCTFVKMDDGLVASNLDITPIKEAEAKIRVLEENQKLEIYKACISTQEEERKRIAEDLRNGIGQILYAAKINLKHVEAEKAINDPEGFEQAKQYTDKILVQAIDEIRRLSHQMTPAILEDFGLEETIMELCKQFQPGIKMSCKVRCPSTRLESYFEVSVYRMVQELLVNVVKHAKATEAIIEVCAKGNTLEVMVQDNGQGFNPDLAMEKCLGLSTLVNKVHLLNGTITIHTDHGTKVNIVLPLKMTD